jgi:hypothetical protein
MPKILFLGDPHSKEGFAETERKSLPDFCPEHVGVRQRDVGNEGKGYAKITR